MHRGRWLVVMLLTAHCGAAAPTSPAATAPVDVLDFLIGNPALWPRLGSHSQNQVVDVERREVCWVKYANAKMFECWRWDDDFVYHVVDHAVDGNTGESYSFSDGRWLPRRLTGTWTLDVADNRITWFDPRCRVEARSGVFPYRQRAWIEPARDAGPDLGTRETLVLEYQPYDPVGAAGAVEQFYFGWHAGWYEWDRGSAHDMFNRLGGPSPKPALDTMCGGS
jgi:hypothetical protein